MSFFSLVLWFSLAIGTSQVTRASAPGCPLDAAAVTQSLVPRAQNFQFECHDLNTLAAQRSYLALVSLNNPDKGAETYLAVFSLGADGKKAELLKSQLVGMEAFPMRRESSLRFSLVLTNAKAEELKIATNALHTAQNTALTVWAVNPRTGIIRELEKTILPANHIPEAQRTKSGWIFSAKGKKVFSYTP